MMLMIVVILTFYDIVQCTIGHKNGPLDVIIDDSDRVIFNSPYSRQKRKFVNSANLWTFKGPIYYKTEPKLNYTEVLMVDRAMREMSEVTCLDFQTAPTWLPDDDLSITFLRGVGCSSNIGRRFYSGPQAINTEPSCFQAVGVIFHEMMHVLGFTHEHNRPDRDSHVTILWENIDHGFEGQFERMTTAQVLTEPADYDLGSVMHYRTTTFSKRQDLPVIRTNDPDYQWTIGQRNELSFMDAKFLNYMYCKDKCPPNPNCQRGSYAHPKDCNRCLCPSGFSGQFCDQVRPGVNSNCGDLIELDPIRRPWATIHSPNYPTQYDFDQQCSWLIRCPEPKRVKLDFSGPIDVACKPDRYLCLDYVEVRKVANFTNTGPRFCCDFYPKNGIVSDGSEMVVLFKTFHWAKKSGFQANVGCY